MCCCGRRAKHHQENFHLHLQSPCQVGDSQVPSQKPLKGGETSRFHLGKGPPAEPFPKGSSAGNEEISRDFIHPLDQLRPKPSLLGGSSSSIGHFLAWGSQVMSSQVRGELERGCMSSYQASSESHCLKMHELVL